MSIGRGDGITLPEIKKCADIKRKKSRHIAHCHRGVANVVTLSLPCPALPSPHLPVNGTSVADLGCIK
jgi:hypothetical protein